MQKHQQENQQEAQQGQKEQRKNRISYSELKVWNECPYKHKLIYIDREDYFNGNEYTAFGTAMHATCEEIVSKDPPKNLVHCFLEHFEAEIKKLNEFDSAFIEEMKREGTRLIPQILPAMKEHFGDFHLISTEDSLMEDMLGLAIKGKKFKGFIDLVLKTTDGKYHIIDWKTCSWGWNQRKKSDTNLLYQLILYKNFYSLKYNIELENIETHFGLLKRTPSKNNVEIFRVSSGQKRTNNALKLLDKALINIKNENYIKNRLSCKYCVFKNTELCP